MNETFDISDFFIFFLSITNLSKSTFLLIGHPVFFTQVDTALSAELAHSGHFEVMSLQTDEDEHSIEMHLPYVAKVMESQKGHFKVQKIS